MNTDCIVEFLENTSWIVLPGSSLIYWIGPVPDKQSPLLIRRNWKDHNFQVGSHFEYSCIWWELPRLVWFTSCSIQQNTNSGITRRRKDISGRHWTTECSCSIVGVVSAANTVKNWASPRHSVLLILRVPYGHTMNSYSGSPLSSSSITRLDTFPISVTTR